MNIWNYLRLFESRDNVSEKYKKLHGGDLSAGKANEIITNFNQARQYFFSAFGADIIVKPLLLYYGMASLARGVVLIASIYSREASLRPSHGLETVEWQTTISSDIEKLRVRSCNGLFLELLQATTNKAYYYHNSTKVNTKRSYPEIPAGLEFLFSDILRMVPDLKDMYNRWSDEHVMYPVVNSVTIKQDPNIIAMVVSGIDDPSVLETYTQRSIKIISNINKRIEFEVARDAPIQFVQLFRGAFDIIGEVCLAHPPAGSKGISMIGIVSIISFFMGMIARYFPTTWISLSHGMKGDKIYPLLLQVLDYIEEYGPRLFWDYLEGPYNFEKD